jgi:integrase
LRGREGERQKHRAVDMADPEVRRARQATANKIWGGVFKPALNHAWRGGKVADDKAWRAVRPFKGATASRMRYLARDEIGRLVNAADPDFRGMLRAGLHTGCRYSELCRLAPTDFNADAHTLAVRTSKSGKARHVHLTDEAVEFFTGAVALAGGRPRLFVRADGEAWRTSWQIRLMTESSKHARLTPPATFHTLRHTYASHAVMNGTPLLVVARNLGHRDTRMCELHYSHLSPSYARDAIKAGALRFESGGHDKVATFRQK